MIPFNRFLIIQSSIFLIIFSVSCKGTKDKISNDVTTKKLDSLPLIQKHFFEQEKRSNGYCLLRGKSGSKVVALTFDDGPTNLSNKILDVLNKLPDHVEKIWLPWKIFGSNGNINQPNNIIKSFIKRKL